MGYTIIYKFDPHHHRYVIGQHPVDYNDIYIPVSFIFHKCEIIPYEWAHSSVCMDPQEYEVSVNIIRSVATRFNYDFFPLGLSVGFRFKTSLFTKVGGTVEIPKEDGTSTHASYSYIITQDKFERSGTQLTLEQVAWHPYANSVLALDKKENSLLNELRMLIYQTEDQNDRI